MKNTVTPPPSSTKALIHRNFEAEISDREEKRKNSFLQAVISAEQRRIISQPKTFVFIVIKSTGCVGAQLLNV